MRARRLALFIDYQNVYRRFREAFGCKESSSEIGQVDPTKLGRLIAARSEDTRLESVFVYRGIPDGNKDPIGYAACRRQLDTWAAMPNVEAHTRPLQYTNNVTREKGIDVKLAIDYVRAQTSGRFDVLALFSGDSDLAPAVEFVYDRYQTSRVSACVIAWKGGPRINLQDDRRVWCHYLDRNDYDLVADRRLYSRPSSK